MLQASASRSEANAATAAPPASGKAAPTATGIVSDLCDSSCIAEADKLERQKLKSGVEFIDIKVGKGPKPRTGEQIAVNYIAMTPEGKVVDSSLAKNKVYDIRFGAGSVIPGLDQGLATMQTGGIRRMFIPGDLAFPKGLGAAAGRPRLPPKSPCIFDVQLIYIPGASDDLDMGDS